MLGEGDFFGQPFKLRTWQKAFLYRLYELREDGSRRYRKALLGLPKNNGKTPLAAAIAAYELLGGQTVSPIVTIGAASFEQADLVFGDLKVMCRESRALAPFTEVYDTEILIKGHPGRAYRVAAARGTNDGARPSCFIADELHEWNDPAKEGAHLVLANGTTKRADSLQFNITTAGFDLDSLLGRLYLKGRKIEKQIADGGPPDDDSFLFVWYEAPDVFDLETEDGLRKAILSCNPAAGDFLRVDDVMARFREIPRFEAERYFLNRWTRSSESWLPPGAWQSCLGPAEIPDGAEVWAGVDVALRHDSTAVVVAWPREDGRTVVRSRIWTPDGDTTDVADVMQHIRELGRRYDLREVAYDPRFFEFPAGQLADEGYPMVEFPQSAERMIPACGHAYNQIVAGNVAHDGDPLLEDHVLSAAIRPGERGWTLSKGQSKRKIDAAIAMVIALYRSASPSGPTLKPFAFFG